MRFIPNETNPTKTAEPQPSLRRGHSGRPSRAPSGFLVWVASGWFALWCFALLWFASLCLGLLRFARVCFALPWVVLVCFGVLCFALACFGLLWFASLCRDGLPRLGLGRFCLLGLGLVLGRAFGFWFLVFGFVEIGLGSDCR